MIKDTIEYTRKERLSFRSIVTICGSSRFKDEIQEVVEECTIAGFTVFTLVCFDRSKTDENGLNYSPNLKRNLIASHFHKISISDVIYVVDGLVNGKHYIGKHTQNEIDYAKEIGIEVWFRSKVLKERKKVEEKEK